MTTAPRRINQLEEAERELSAVLEEFQEGSMSEFELGLVAGKLAAMRWALGIMQGPISPPRAVLAEPRPDLAAGSRDGLAAAPDPLL
jgi:hypothetical protein